MLPYHNDNRVQITKPTLCFKWCCCYNKTWHMSIFNRFFKIISRGSTYSVNDSGMWGCLWLTVIAWPFKRLQNNYTALDNLPHITAFAPPSCIWRHDMATLFTLLALCEKNPPVPLIRPCKGELLYFSCRSSEQVAEQTAQCQWFKTPWLSCDIIVIIMPHNPVFVVIIISF